MGATHGKGNPLVAEIVRHLSHSQINTWLGCGEQYRLAKIEKAPEYPAAWFSSGRAFHAAIEQWERGRRTMSVAEAQELYVSEYDREIAADQEKCPDLSLWLKSGT